MVAQHGMNPSPALSDGGVHSRDVRRGIGGGPYVNVCLFESAQDIAARVAGDLGTATLADPPTAEHTDMRLNRYGLFRVRRGRGWIIKTM